MKSKLESIYGIRGFLALGVLIGLLSYGLIYAQTNPVEAHMPEDTRTTLGGGIGNIWHILEHIYEEEQKQTALLDQISCTMYANWASRSDMVKQCGEPLNYTGVWKSP